MSGGGGTTQQVTTATIPPELKPLISGAAGIVQGFQPRAADYFTNLFNQGDPHTLDIAPMSATENRVLGLTDQGLNFVGSMDPGFWQEHFALNLDPGYSPLIRAAQTPVSSTEAEQAFRDAMLRGTAISGAPVSATEAESAFRTAMQRGSDIAGTSLTTPGAETSALSQIASLTGGPLGSAPSTMEGIDFLRHLYETRTKPELENALSIAGLGRSGALGESLARAEGDLLGAQAGLLRDEYQARQNMVPQLLGIGQAQTARETAPIERELAYKTSQFAPLLQGAQFQQAQEQIPIDRELAFKQSQFAPLLQGAQFQQAQEQIPIDRQIQTAIASAPAFAGLTQQALDMGTLGSQIGALPRTIQQQQNQAAQDLDLRYQALAEAGILGPLGVMPSLLGSQMSQIGSGGGMFNK